MSRVIDAMFERKVAPGEYVIRQGDDGDNFYVIETGVFDFFKKTGRRTSDADPGQQVLRLDGHGSFGELALMYNQPRAASVVAVTGGVVWAMDRQSFRRIVMRSAHRKRQVRQQACVFRSAQKHYRDSISKKGTCGVEPYYLIVPFACAQSAALLPVCCGTPSPGGHLDYQLNEKGMNLVSETSSCFFRML